MQVLIFPIWGTIWAGYVTLVPDTSIFDQPFQRPRPRPFQGLSECTFVYMLAAAFSVIDAEHGLSRSVELGQMMAQRLRQAL